MPPAERAAVAGPSRPLPRALVLAAAVLLAARVGTGVWEERHPPEGGTMIRWAAPAEAAGLAQRTGLPVLYDFGAAWCMPCGRMDADVFADSRVVSQIPRVFVPVRVVDRRREDGHNDAAVDSLQRIFGITSFPTLVVATPGQPGMLTLRGYPGRRQTLLWLHDAPRRLRAAHAGVSLGTPEADSMRSVP